MTNIEVLEGNESESRRNGESELKIVGVHGPGRLRRCQRQVNFSVFFSWQFHIDKTATAGVGRCSLVTLKFLYIKLTGFAGI